MLTFLDCISEHVVGVKISGKLTHEDYHQIVTKIEGIVRTHGKVSTFVELEDCQGWELRDAWADLLFGIKHHGDFDRCAVVGGKKWHKWLVQLAKPFFHVKYFEKPQFEEAWKWVAESSPAEITKV